MSLTGTNQRSQQENALSLILLMNHFENLFFGVLHHFLSRKIGICDAGSCKEQTKVVIDFGGGTYGRTRILVGSLLFNGNNRAQTSNLIHIRTLHASQKVTGISREGFDVSSLSFRKNGIEGQGGFSATTQSGNHGQTIAWNFHIDVLQIMDTGTIYIDIFFFFHDIVSLITQI